MKTEKRKLDFEIDRIQREHGAFDSLPKTTIEVVVLGEFFNHESLELTADFNVPDSVLEFREKHNLSKDELVDWLNKNYHGF